MARIASCTSCGIEFYDSSEQATHCNRCETRITEKKAKLHRIKSFYERLKRRGGYKLRYAVINCITRDKLTIDETAEVLGRSYETIKWEWDAIRQDAR